jgi:hypothetical protein
MSLKHVAIVGGGFSGMYCALLLIDRYPNVQINLFEKEKYLGGRNKMGTFENIPVSNGAGVIRDRDVLLKNLCQRFNIPIKSFQSKVNYAFDTKNKSVTGYIKLLKSLKKFWNRAETFSQNFQRLLGKEHYLLFVSLCGYTDFQHTDIDYAVKHYGFQDVISNQTLYSVSWDNLMTAMKNYLLTTGRFKLHLNTLVTGNLQTNYDFLIWCGARPSWEKLNIQGQKWKDAISQISCQSFLRAYAIPKNKLEKEKAKLLFPTTTYFFVDNPLQKIMVMQKPQKTFYMISYSDNLNSLLCNSQISKNQFLQQWTGLNWNTSSLSKFYHSCGTHYYKPFGLQTQWKSIKSLLKYLQHPTKKIYLCNEGLSLNQGWTEGALESAQFVVDHLTL